MFHLLILISGFLLLNSVGGTQKQDLYVKPTPTSSGCPQSEVCMTFSNYLQNVSDYFISNTAIHFLPGNHTIESSEPSRLNDHLLVSDVHNLTLMGYTGVTTLHCTERFGLTFVNIKQLRISNIRITNCGQTIVAGVLTDFDGFYQSTKVALTLVNLHSLVLHNVQIKESYGYGLIGVNVFGNSTITNCIFTHNMWRSDDANTSCTPNCPYATPGGNAVFAYPITQQFPDVSPDALHISQCEFAYGINKNTFDFPKFIGSHSRIISWGSGLGILLYEQQLLLKINIVNSVFHHNNASYGLGANVFVSSLGTRGTEMVSALNFNNCTFYGGNAIKGGGIFIYKSRNMTGTGQLAVRFSNSTITNNSARTGGGLNIIVDLPNRYLADAQEPIFRIENSVFSDNKAMQGAAIHVVGYGGFHVSTVTAMVTSIHFNISQTTLMHNVAEKSGSCVHIFTVHGAKRNNNFRPAGLLSVLLSNSTFQGNNGSTVYVNASKLIISGAVRVFDNHGVSGGGFYFDCNPQSYIYLTPHSQLYMVNNTASLHGGGMAVKDCNPSNIKECFIQILDKDEECLPWFSKPTADKPHACNDTKMVLENNLAEIAGDSIYGGSLETCYILLSGEQIYFSMLQGRIFEIRNKLSLSEITSDPFQVCFCNKNFTMDASRCVNETQAEVYHGQTLQIPAVATGQFHNASPALIRTRIITDVEEILLGERQNFQELGRDCASLVYLFDFSRKKVSSFQLNISIAQSSLNTFPAVVFVTVLNCPPGFELTSDLSTCECESHLMAHGIECDIDTQKFNRPIPMWIGYFKGSQVAIHSNCPFHYCKQEDNEITLDDQDEQCAFNRHGVLCGACQQGLSLALGSSRCLKCSNAYFLLLIPFALAGVALVFLLLKSNLTVSVGSINGLIFYVNIVQVNRSTFFPQGTEHMSLLTKCLSIFVAWLNLDLGIQTCFFAGLNAYTKTWLQFVFPVYVWIMVGFMIYGSRYYPTVSRLIGSNAVQVLATLFLLSYAKLLRTVIAAFYSTALTGKNSSTPLVWLLDGNVLFFRGTHIALLLMALASILLFIVPFTTLILLAPCLQANSNHRVLRLVNIKLKPLLDAYQGPYKDRFRYWTGLMLLVRTVLFTVFAGNVLGKPEIDLFAILVSIHLLLIFYWNTGRVYKKFLWNITESFYLLNLVILTAATSLLRGLNGPINVSSRSQEIVTDVMVGTAFIVFCAIVVYHICVYVLKTSVTRASIKQAVKRLLKNKVYNREQPDLAVNLNTSGTPGNSHTVSHIELNQLREPLLSLTS